MKKCFLFVAIACVLSVLSQAQVYNFPVRPGTETWSNLVTEEDRFSAMQIPEDQLVSMSTQDLVITCMNYPAWLYFTAFNNPQDGIDINIHNFNGLQELMKRADAHLFTSKWMQLGWLLKATLSIKLLGLSKGLILNCY